MAGKSNFKIIEWRILLACLGLALAAVILILIWHRRAVPTTAQTVARSAEAEIKTESDPMDAFLLEREQLRAMQTAQLNEIIHDAGTDEETQALARRQLLQLCDWMEKETTIEGLLRLRGFEDAVCTVHGDSVNVVIRGQAVGSQESALIYDLVLRETGVTGGNVKIVPIP